MPERARDNCAQEILSREKKYKRRVLITGRLVFPYSLSCYGLHSYAILYDVQMNNPYRKLCLMHSGLGLAQADLPRIRQ